MTNQQVPKGRIRFGLPSRDRSRPAPFGTGGALAGVLVVVLVVGGLFWSATSGRPASAQRPQVFAGSLVLEDTRPLTVVNVATAQVTVRLEGVNSEVGAAADGDVQPVPVAGGTVLVNRLTGSFNFLDADNYVTDPNGPGVGLGQLAGSTGAEGFGSGPNAYIVRAAPSSTVSLVGRRTVAEAASAASTAAGGPPAGKASPAAVPPLGFSDLGGPVALRPGSAAVLGSDLWTLVGDASACHLVQLVPAPTSSQGLTSRTRAYSPLTCGRSALEAGSSSVAMASPGQTRLFPAGGSPFTVRTPFTVGAARIVPVAGAGREVWFLFVSTRGWDLFGIGPGGRVAGPYPLSGFGPFSDPVVPALSSGFLYTLDQSQTGQPTLWTIDVANGRMAPLRGTHRYPILNKSEKASFHGAEVLVDGPRVVFNNPQSLEAVIVFTDSDRLPVVVDKSRAVTVSATGPADLHQHASATAPSPKSGPGSNPVKSPVPVVQPVSQQVTCAKTTQKPYAPQITAITASSGAALVQWSYQLLDQTDCEPDAWSVQMEALTGGHQPAKPIQTLYGQNQYLFQGLRPSTTYQVTVTAYINRQSTPSAPATFTTTARGPDAPLSVSTVSDGNGHWIVSWTPCTESANPNCVVPADQWTVTGAACNGSFVGTPPSIQVPAGQDSVTIDAGSLNLLGDYLSFTVQGTLASGLAGNPTSDRSCTEAYQKPDASAITVQGQGQVVPATNTVSATLTVETTGNPDTAFGVPAADAEFVYTVSSGAGTKTVGPTGRTSAQLTGLPPGEPLTPSVKVYPAGHPEDAVTVTGASFQQTLPWPDLSGASAAGTVDHSDPNRGTVAVLLPGDLPSGPLDAVAPTTADAPGSGPQVQCGGPGGAVTTYPVQAVGPGRQLTFPMSDLVDMGGQCTISFSLNDGANPDPYGGPSPVVAVPFQIGLPGPSYTFSFSFVGGGFLGNQYVIQVDAGGPYQGGGDWTITAHDRNLPQQADLCYTSEGDSTPPKFPYDVQLPLSCPNPGHVAVTVGWTYLGQTQSFTGTPRNQPPPPPPPPSSTTTTTKPPGSTTTTTGSTSTTSSSTSTSSTSSTTSSTTSTTLPPCPTSTTSSSTSAACATTTTTNPKGTTKTATASATAVAAAGVGPGVAIGAAWMVGVAGRIRTRRKRKKEAK